MFDGNSRSEFPPNRLENTAVICAEHHSENQDFPNTAM